MHNRVNEIRRLIRTLRVSMLEAEAIMRQQINRDEDCSFVAGDILKMRAVMSGLVQERTLLGDNEPIVVNVSSIRERAAVVFPAATQTVKRHLESKPWMAQTASLGEKFHRNA
jgi:hypothetical protein